MQSPLRAAELCTWVLHSHRWGKNEAKIRDSEKERMFATAMRMMAAKAKKGKPKMKPIEPRTPPEQTQTITRAIFDVVKEHGPLTIADAWDHLKESGLRGLTSKRHMKILLRWMRERQKLRLICNHDGPHKQFLYTTWFTNPKAMPPPRNRITDESSCRRRGGNY